MDPFEIQALKKSEKKKKKKMEEQFTSPLFKINSKIEKFVVDPHREK